MTRTYSQIHHTDKYPEHSSIIWSGWPNGWMFVFELSGSGFESSCSHLNFGFCACFKQGVLWHSGNYRVWIHSEMHTWHDKNIKSNAPADKHSEHSSIICLGWPNGWVFVYELSGSGFKSSCSHLNPVTWKIHCIAE